MRLYMEITNFPQLSSSIPSSTVAKAPISSTSFLNTRMPRETFRKEVEDRGHFVSVGLWSLDRIGDIQPKGYLEHCGWRGWYGSLGLPRITDITWEKGLGKFNLGGLKKNNLLKKDELEQLWKAVRKERRESVESLWFSPDHCLMWGSLLDLWRWG